MTSTRRVPRIAFGAGVLSAALALGVGTVVAPAQAAGTLSTCDGAPTTQRQPLLGSTVTGTAGDDVLSGTGAGLGGARANNTINALAGDDRVCGLDGDDAVSGGDGADRLFGEAGSDSLRGGAGDDLLDGGAGTNALRGEAGDDVLLTVLGSLDGGDGDDDLTGNGTLTGGEGADALIGSGLLDGGAGADLLTGNGLTGSLLLAGPGQDRLTGSAIPERPRAEPPPADTGGRIVAGDPDETSLVAGSPSVATAPVLVVPGGLHGGDDADVLDGGGGGDELLGGAGDDVLRGGAGDDARVLLYPPSDFPGSTDPTLVGGLFGGAGNDVLDGGAGADHLDGGDGFDTCTGTVGVDVFVSCEVVLPA